MYNTTGFTRDEVIELCAIINAAELEPGTKLWPPILGLFRSAVVALTYMRRNRVQAEIAESFGVSQPTASRAISAMTSIIKKVLAPYVPTADELEENMQYIIDGTLLPCWSWTARTELYSGKHKTTGMNIQVACNFAGRLAWISDPVDGSRHDSYCMDESGVLITEVRERSCESICKQDAAGQAETGRCAPEQAITGHTFSEVSPYSRD